MEQKIAGTRRHDGQTGNGRLRAVIYTGDWQLLPTHRLCTRRSHGRHPKKESLAASWARHVRAADGTGRPPRPDLRVHLIIGLAVGWEQRLCRVG